MHGGAVSLAKQFLEQDKSYDIILATDMLDLSTFLSLTREKSTGIPTAIYFHENQLTYPWSETDRDLEHKRDLHYGFINYASALSADKVFFNSAYHRESFLEALGKFLRFYPDERNLDTIPILEQKSEVWHLGLDLKRFDKHRVEKDWRVPRILWNHRWEYDKNPEEFFEGIRHLKAERIPFELVVLGGNFAQSPRVFEEAEKEFSNEIIQWGYCESFEEYASWLWKSDFLPVTSNQDFFGISIVEAAYCCVEPLLPKRLSYPELFPFDHQYSDYRLALQE